MEQIQTRKTGEYITRGEMMTNLLKESRVRKSKPRILAVDDEPTVVEVVRDILVSNGFDVLTAKNGMEAVDFLMSSRQFDLLITDMKMPGMDGIELLRQAHQLKKNLPVIIITGCGTIENGIHSLEEGACDYVLKPFDTEKLVFVVEEALKGSSV